MPLKTVIIMYSFGSERKKTAQ